jgi:hypothetical protein
MGHIRLGRPPRTKKWQQVVASLQAGADVASVAAATSEAAESALKKAAADPAFSQAVWLLVQLPLAARRDDFPAQLQTIGLDVSSSPGVLEIAGALSQTLDARARQHGSRTDFGDMARLAATESLTAMVGRSLPGLFGHTPDDVRSALARLAQSRSFAELARDFFARLTRRHLEYYLGRELPNHLGPGARFSSARQQAEFSRDLDLHCREASRILKEFASDWFWKASSRGPITPKKVERFAHVALQKITAELRQVVSYLAETGWLGRPPSPAPQPVAALVAGFSTRFPSLGAGRRAILGELRTPFR